MKYFAILKDSLYEAIDTKVFYVMVGLSCVVLIIVASASYAPVTVEDEAQRIAGMATWVLGMRSRGKDATPPPAVSVADFGESNAERPLYERDYHFTLVLQMPKAAPNGDARPDEPQPAPRPAPKVGGHHVFLVQMLARQQLEYLKDVTFATLESADPGEARLAVTSHGSKVTRPADWPHEPTVFFGLPIPVWHAPVGNFVRFWEDGLVNTIGAAITLLISAVITAFFIPNMLRKGTVDLLLVKPIHRSTLLIYKYIGGLAFMFLNTTFVVVGVWVILGLRTGLWGPGFLVSIPVLTFQFALYYAVSTLAGVITRSSIVAILMTCLAWFFFALIVGWGYGWVDATRQLNALRDEQDDVLPEEAREGPPIARLPDWGYTTADVVHFVTPRLKDLDNLTSKLILNDTLPDYSRDRKLADRLMTNFHWGQALSVTTIYIVVLLALSCWWFAMKDY